MKINNIDKGGVELHGRNSIIFIGMACLLFPVSAGTVFASGASAGTSLVTKNGPIKGVRAKGVYAYKGIPYAKAPVGDLRFAPPQDAEPWTEVRDCTKYGPIIPQWLTVSLRLDNTEQSEDALILNVWTPSAPKKNDKLPVYVFIHGGGYAFGSGNEKDYDGTGFAQDGVVAVTINYRLSTLGFFASNETYNQYGTTGNWGILDQIKALEWVRDNIAEFGGDPDQVTIGGESAGSLSVSALVLSPLAKGLFRSAIMESGAILAAQAMASRGDLQKSIEQSQELAGIFGASDTAEGLAYLRRLDGYVLNYLSPFSLDQTKPATPFYLTPVFDGVALPKDPVAALREGNYNKVNLLLGFNHDEGTLLIPPTVDAGFYENFGSRMAGENWPVVAERFPVDEHNTAAQRAQQMLAYAWFTASEKVFADALASNNRVFMYNFNFVAQGDPQSAALGAYHTAELPYVFNNIALKGFVSAENEKLAKEMHTRWINFIKNGDPNVGITPPTVAQWPQYNPENPDVIFFDNEITTGPLPNQEDFDFIAHILYGVGN
ncbi:MAG: carboxylesterase family protein [Treponema sp.]|jgi:para-nitrobenzyl esterase|nr:carboxylesterase family protein [Treponema sp.]